MTASIPASAIVNVNPGVIGAGGTALSLNGLFLTGSTRVPVGTVMSFPSQLSVAAFFGSSAQEASIARVYFAGFDNSNVKPGAVLFSQYPLADVSGYLRGASLAALTLTQLQALAGVLIVTIDGVVKTSSAISLAGATSFSNASQIINAALGQAGPTAATLTGAIAGTTLTVSAVATGNIEVGQVLSGNGVTAATYITALGTGTGGTGTYTVSVSQTASSTAITAKTPPVTYDSVSSAFVVTSPTAGLTSTISFGSGSIATSIGLTAVAGAVTSQGAVAATPTDAMDAIVAQTQNFAGFTTSFEPDTADKLEFATWNSGKNNRYIYAAWDTDITATQTPDTGAAGALIIGAGNSGTSLIYEPTDLNHAAFLLGSIASIDFTETNGRVTLAFRAQAGITPGVTSQQIAANLIANGYNFYGAYATATQAFNFFQTGSITGPFLWIDSYVNQIKLNADLQQSLLSLLTQVKSVPYNDQGYTLIREACTDPINAALNFGTIRSNVPLSALQAAEVNAAAGLRIDDTLSTRGWYLQIQPASAEVRAARGSPPMTLWYVDGQSVQAIALASIEIQ